MKVKRQLVNLGTVCLALLMLLSACGTEASTPTLIAPTAITAAAPTDTAMMAAPTATTAMAAPTDTAMMVAPTATSMMAAPTATTAAPTAGGPVNLSWWSVTNGQGWLDSYSASCNAYAKLVTGFGCSIQVTTNGFVQLAADLTAGIGPDIYHTAGSRLAIAPYVKAGQMMDLSNTEFVKNAPEAAKAPWTFDGKVYGVAIDSFSGGLYYNADTLAQNGVSVPTSFPELLAACDALKAKNIIPISPMFADSWTAGLLSVFIQATTVAATDPDWFSKRVQGTVNFADDPGWQKMVQEIADMQSHGCFGDAPTATGYSDSEAMFLAGQAAMWVQGTWAAGGMEAKGADPTKIQLVTFPASDMPNGSYLGASVGNGFNVNPKGKNPEEAVALLENTYGSLDLVKQFAKFNGGFTLYNPEAITAADQKMFTTFAEQFNSDKRTLWTADYMIGGTQEKISELLQGMLSGALPQSEVLPQLDTAWDTYQKEHPEVVDALK